MAFVCRFPVRYKNTKGLVVRCGRCIPCRRHKQNQLKNRILLESYAHEGSCFITLTYDDKYCPSGLQRTEAQKFMKRLRHHIKKAGLPPIKYFMIGEYGSKTLRPHYHAIVFGLPECMTNRRLGVKKNMNCRCQTCMVVKQAWTNGMVDIGTVTPQSAAYVTGYCTKKGTKSHEEAIKHMPAEFKVESNGLGKKFIEHIKGYLKSETHTKELRMVGDVLSHIKISGEVYHFDKYLKDQCREILGLKKETPEHILTSYLRMQMSEYLEHDGAIDKDLMPDANTRERTLALMARQKCREKESRIALKQSKL